MADTISLVSASIKDVLFSQRAPQTRLEVPLKAAPSAEFHIEDDLAAGDSADPNDGYVATATREWDQTFTDIVINATGPNANPRMRSVMASLVRHLHDFCRENQITIEEYMACIELINAAGKMSDGKRNETQLLLAILGVESVVEEIDLKKSADADSTTGRAFLDPIYPKDAPRRQMGDSIVAGFEESPDHALIRGRVLSASTGQPIANAELGVWQTVANGLYKQQDLLQPDMDLRGRFTTGPDGAYIFRCLRPTKYPIPNDGPAGKVLQLLGWPPWWPSRMHFTVSAPGYRKLVTQIFDLGSEYASEGEDVAFAVKEGLVVDFMKRDGEERRPQWELEYDFRLVGNGEGG